MKEKMDALEECKDILKNYELGLKLVQTRIGKDEFIITKDVIESPESYLNNLIKTTFKENE